MRSRTGHARSSAWCLASAAVLLAACGGKSYISGGDAGADHPLDMAGAPDGAADTAPVATAEMSVTAAGGELTLGNVHLVIPPGAVAGTVTVRIEQRSSARAVPPPDEILGPIYDFFPEDLVFLSPAVVTFDHVDGTVGSGDGDDGVAVAWWDTAIADWVSVPSWGTAGASAVSAEMAHFSSWGPRKPRKPGQGCSACEVLVEGTCVPLSCADPCSVCDVATGCRRPAQAGPQTTCGLQHTCVDLASDVKNCGGCGHKCAFAATCTAGTCSCPSGQSFCPEAPAPEGLCTNLQTDEDNCGSCLFTCAVGKNQRCVDGACVCRAGFTQCVFNDELNQPFGDGCADLQNDRDSCGGCNTHCPKGSDCIAGKCSVCTSTDTSQCPSSCDKCVAGQCQPTCTGCSTCFQGQCLAQCPSCQTCDGNACVAMKCGPCQQCLANACVSDCTQGESCCGTPGSCVSTTSDSNCGGCGNVCPSGYACTNGSCQCAAGTSDCSSGGHHSCCGTGQICFFTGADAACCGPTTSGWTDNAGTVHCCPLGQHGSNDVDGTFSCVE